MIEACRAVGMSSESAYTLRAREGADSFRAAWDAALRHALGRVADNAVGRAINGVATPIFYKGEQVGERRRYNDRLAMFLLRTRGVHPFGPPQPALGAQDEWDDARHDLDLACERLHDEADKEDQELHNLAEDLGIAYPFDPAADREPPFRRDVSSTSSTSGAGEAGEPGGSGPPGTTH